MAVIKVSNILYKICGVAILLSSFLGGWVVMDYQQYVDSPLPIAKPGYRLVISPGTSLKHFSNELHQAGIVSHPRYLRWLAGFGGKAQSIKAGEYLFAPDITPRQLLEQVISGAVMQHSLTVVEGWTFAELLEELHRQDTIEHTLDGLDDQQIMERLGFPGQNPEGRFMPDTYRYPRGTSDVDFLRRAYQTMETRLDEEWRQRDQGLPYQTPYQALIMASIIEKETALPKERPEIAGVFVRRLQRGMRLQTDPTVIYGLGSRFDGNLRRQDLITDSPYNTYMHAGLPPTPIALPGTASIHAALHPASGNALYFVSRGDGSHVFSATLEEHNKAVRRYQIDANHAANNDKAK